jgi:hypothetical protein
LSFRSWPSMPSLGTAPLTPHLKCRFVCDKRVTQTGG